VWHFLFGLNGRISRAAFCLFATIAFGALLVLLAALYAYAIMAGNYENGGPTPWPSSPLGMTVAAFWLFSLFVLLVSGVLVSLKRLHDRNKSVWWLLVFIALPNVLSTIGRILPEQSPDNGAEIGFVFDAAALAIFVWAFIELACLAGTSGENRFGGDPLLRR